MPYGDIIQYPNASPNGTSSQFLYCADSSAKRMEIRSNGGIANFSGNNANLCDEREKKNIVSLDEKWDKVKSWEAKSSITTKMQIQTTCVMELLLNKLKRCVLRS